MKICAKCKIEKYIINFSKKSTNKDGLKNTCKLCDKDIRANWYLIHSDRLKLEKRTYYKNNKDQYKTNIKIYATSNRGKVNAISSKRHAAKLQRTPKWLTQDDFLKIEAIYKLASAIQNITGTKYQVDHILPLQGKEISGFHMPSNLQIITAKENIKKGNKLNYVDWRATNDA